MFLTNLDKRYSIIAGYKTFTNENAGPTTPTAPPPYQPPSYQGTPRHLQSDRPETVIVVSNSEI